MEIRLTRTRLIVLAALVAAGGVYLLIDWLVVTDRERVEQAVAGLARAVESGDPRAIEPYLADDFRPRGLKPEEFATWYAGFIAVFPVQKVSLYDCTVAMDKSDPDRAAATVMSIVVAKHPAGDFRLDWRLEFRRENKTEWKLELARAWLPLNGAEIDFRAAAQWAR